MSDVNFNDTTSKAVTLENNHITAIQTTKPTITPNANDGSNATAYTWNYQVIGY